MAIIPISLKIQCLCLLAGVQVRDQSNVKLQIMGWEIEGTILFKRETVAVNWNTMTKNLSN